MDTDNLNQPEGYRSEQGKKKLKVRVWTVGTLSGLGQLSLPILVLVALFATLLNECKAIFTGPSIDGEESVLHDGDIHYLLNEPTEVEDERRLVHMKVDPTGGEPVEVSELERSTDVSIFSSPGQLAVHEGALVRLTPDGVLVGDEVVGYPYVSGATRVGRPLLHDGRVAIALAHRDYGGPMVVEVHALEGRTWQQVASLRAVLPKDADYEWSDARVVMVGDKPTAYVTSTTSVLYRVVEGHDETTSMKELGREVAWVDVVGDRVFYATLGPDLDETLDKLEGIEPEGGETITELVAVGYNGERAFSAEARGLDKFAAVDLGDGEVGLVSDDKDALELRVVRDASVGEIRRLGGSTPWLFEASLWVLALLWLFGGGLITIATAFVLAGGMARHRDEDEVRLYASLTQRALARSLDVGIIVGVAVAVGLVIDNEYVVTIAALFVSGVFIILEGHLGLSLGKLLFGIRVVDVETHRPPGIGKAFIRTLLLGIDNVLGLVGLICVALGKRWQSVGDLAAGTAVVRASAVATAS